VKAAAAECNQLSPWEEGSIKSISLTSHASLLSLLATFTKPLSKVPSSYFQFMNAIFFFNFYKFLMFCFLIELNCLDRLAIVKNDRNIGKGARAARLQRNKMVLFDSVSMLLLFLFIIFSFRIIDL